MNNDGTDVKFTKVDIVYNFCDNNTSKGYCYPLA